MKSIFATVADCRAFNGASVPPSQEALILNNGAGGQGRYIFLPTSSSPDNNAGQLVIVPTAGTGRWIRRDPVIDLVLPITFATADGANLVTIPAELTLVPIFGTMFWEMTSAWAGGVASTIGLSMTNPAHPRNKGGVMGGVAGNTGFTSACFYQPTVGTDMSGNAQMPVLSPGATILHDHITSAFTSGAGNVHLPCVNLFTTITPVTPP